MVYKVVINNVLRYLSIIYLCIICVCVFARIRALYCMWCIQVCVEERWCRARDLGTFLCNLYPYFC